MMATAEALVPAIPAGLARIVDQTLAATSGKRVESAKEMAALLAPFAVSERPPSLAPRDSMMPFLSPEARKSRGMARLERAVLGLADPKEKSSVRPNLVLIENAQQEATAARLTSTDYPIPGRAPYSTLRRAPPNTWARPPPVYPLGPHRNRRAPAGRARSRRAGGKPREANRTDCP